MPLTRAWRSMRALLSRESCSGARTATTYGCFTPIRARALARLRPEGRLLHGWRDWRDLALVRPGLALRALKAWFDWTTALPGDRFWDVRRDSYLVVHRRGRDYMEVHRASAQMIAAYGMAWSDVESAPVERVELGR
jgi:hypothetical protein